MIFGRESGILVAAQHASRISKVGNDVAFGSNKTANRRRSTVLLLNGRRRRYNSLLSHVAIQFHVRLLEQIRRFLLCYGLQLKACN